MIKVAHWSRYKGSGMNSLAASLSRAETEIGMDSHIFNLDEWNDAAVEVALDADVHVAHTHFPDELRKKLTKPFKLVWIAHGTPEYVFHETLEDTIQGLYGHGDALMLYHHWMRVADARVTFWPRHQAIMETMAQRGTKIHCLEMGVDKTFWKPGESKGKYAGNPSLWSSENCHWMKAPYDLVTMWPMVWPHLDGASLHLNYLPNDQHRCYAPWMSANGAAYAMHWSGKSFDRNDLRNAFRSVDYFLGLVRYGDFNQLSHQANASGAKSISYAGNEYADFWITEGDQRTMAREMIEILKGNVAPREKRHVSSILDTARGMQEIYEGVLDRGINGWFQGTGLFDAALENSTVHQIPELKKRISDLKDWEHEPGDTLLIEEPPPEIVTRSQRKKKAAKKSAKARR